MDIIVKYIDELLEKSTPEAPMWNIEKLKQGLKSKWNYIDGCMIKAVLEMYAISKDEKYLKFADDFIDYRVAEDGTIDGYSIGEKNIDNVNAGKTLFELYDITGKKNIEKQSTLYILRLLLCLAVNPATSGTRIFIRIRYGWTECIWDSRFTWSTKQDLTTERIMMIFSHSLNSLLKI